MRRSLVLLLFVLLFFHPALIPAEATYRIPWWVVADGGARQTGASHILYATAGQAAIGRVVGPAHIHGIGFWYHPEPSASALTEDDVIPARLALGTSRPSPCGPLTLLRFAVPQRAVVAIGLCDVTGRQVLTLLEDEVDPGNHTLVLDGDRLAAGVYFCRMTAGEFAETRRLVLVK